MGDMNSNESPSNDTRRSKFKASSSLRELIASPKGNTTYENGEAFMLHVFWEAPSLFAANELLSGLEQMSRATHRDTPCVPTYFFRISTHDRELCKPSLIVGEHFQLAAAKKKIQRGVPPEAVYAELVKRRIDPELLTLNDSEQLPESQQLHPVTVEFTEVYLDEQSFMEHAGSRDYLNGYAVVMNPAMHNRTPHTTRVGTPSQNIVEKILEPILREHVSALPDDCTIWRPLSTNVRSTDAAVSFSGDIFISLDFKLSEFGGLSETVSALPQELKTECTTFVAFLHPLRHDTTRVMSVAITRPSIDSLALLASSHPLRGEIHVNVSGVDGAGVITSIKADLCLVGLEEKILVNESAFAGYILHERAADLFPADINT